MREILFKAKGRDGEGWKEGYYWFCQDTMLCFQTEEEQKAIEHHYLLFSGSCDWNLPMPHYKMDIDPETLCQYTGLKDKNGKRIFEDDIVKCQELKSDLSILEYISDVFLSDGCWLVHECETSDVELFMFENQPKKIPLTEIEVIGNKFDNPELLEKKLPSHRG